MIKTFVQALRAGQDINGNRIQIYLEYHGETGDVMAVHMYNDRMPSRLYSCIPLPEMEVSKSFVRSWISRAKKAETILFYNE